MIHIGGRGPVISMSDPGNETTLPRSERLVLELEFPEQPTKEMLEMARWWMEVAWQDVLAAIPKTNEYSGSQGGSADLRLMGDNLAELMGWRGVSDAVKQELAVWFYVQGKAARLVSDYQQQREGKDDTWHDISVYSMMARRLQATGRWP